MPFANQFSLSIEVTRLVPGRIQANKAVEMVLKLARDLQNWGSHTPIEDDLTSMFVR